MQDADNIHPRLIAQPLPCLPDEFNNERARLIANIRALAAVADVTDHQLTPDVFNVLLDLNYRLERAIARLTAERALPGIQPASPPFKRAPNQPK